jgi:hypothetical protein
MEKEAGIVVLILVILIGGIGALVIIEIKHPSSKTDGQIPYSNVASGFFYELTPPSILDNKDEQFWEENRLIKTQFFIDTKFGQYKESNNLYNYTLSNTEDCEKEFDKKNYPISNYYQTSNFNPSKQDLYPARFCWIESISPVKLDCTSQESNNPCLYSSRLSCVCVYANKM